jgi:peptide chain release factor 2
LKIICINCGGIFDVDAKQKTIDEFTQQMSAQGFWDNAEQSAKIVKQLKLLKGSVEPWNVAQSKFAELKELSALLSDDDAQLLQEITSSIASLRTQMEALEFKTLLSGKFDTNSAIVSINSGAGGTESCDWASMLYRMYMRFGEQHDYKVKTIDLLPGEEAGIKNVTMLIEGDFAYGYLKAERGVHRLVRISPFDANKRRHTSFASVDVIPEVAEEVDLLLDEKDLKIDVYRSKGAGGQSVNTTDSAVRITHLPTGIVAQCQNERSQFQNKHTAMQILKARIYEFEQEKKEREFKSAVGGDKKKIEWGSQIRSYVLHPYTMVKDHRTDFETGDGNKVLDGGLDKFIEAYLRLNVHK